MSLELNNDLAVFPCCVEQPTAKTAGSACVDPSVFSCVRHSPRLYSTVCRFHSFHSIRCTSRCGHPAYQLRFIEYPALLHALYPVHSTSHFKPHSKRRPVHQIFSSTAQTAADTHSKSSFTGSNRSMVIRCLPTALLDQFRQAFKLYLSDSASSLFNVLSQLNKTPGSSETCFL